MNIDGVNIESWNRFQEKKSFSHMSERRKKYEREVQSLLQIWHESFEEDFERDTASAILVKDRARAILR